MAEQSRRRRNLPPTTDEGGRRRRGAPPPEQGRRRRGPAATDSPEAVEETPAPAPAASDASGSTRSTSVSTEVTLPQLGESVTEGTITAWLVEVGDTVEADQPLFELSSDKIDTEVPAPTGGVLTEIKVQVDETVDVGTVVAIIGDAEEGDGGGEDKAEDSTDEEPSAEDDTEEQGGDAEAAGSTVEREDVAADAGAEEDDAEPAGEDAEPADEDTEAAEPAEDTEDADAQQDDTDDEQDAQGVLSSPLVRRLAADNDIDLTSIKGSGDGGRITREDVEAAIGDGGGAKKADEKPAEKAPAKESAADKGAKAPAKAAKSAPQPQRRPAADGSRTRVEDLSRIRQRIASKMMESLQSSAQLTTVQEVDITSVMQLRGRVKEEFKQREGVSLSPFVFLCRAAVIAIRNHERVNAVADWNSGRVTFHDYVNLGIAVDTEKGLLVPNVKAADDLSLAGLARAISDVANRARGKGKLEMTDIEGGTFTVTNTGSVGVLIDTPILNYPEVAILGTGAVKKRPVVLESDDGAAIAIRDMLYLSLTYDHRLIDGADAARFVTEVKTIVETHDWAAEIGY
jgi:2-oxoglutarate dehydrogenase E2 component (dihydrolipoamide succinyltransferase)